MKSLEEKFETLFKNSKSTEFIIHKYFRNAAWHSNLESKLKKPSWDRESWVLVSDVKKLLKEIVKEYKIFE